MIILYKGEKREICFEEIKDERYLRGKISPMDLSQDATPKPEYTVSKMGKQEQEHGIYTGKEEGELSQVDQNISFSTGNDTQDNDKISKALVELKAPDPPQKSLYEDFRQVQSSTEKGSEDRVLVENSNKSTICEGKTANDTDNSQSTLCVGLSKKLRVKSNRGRPKKRVVQHRNPFDIGKKFKFKKGANTTVKRSQKRKRKEVANDSLQIIPTRVIGSSVQEALEILATAENMGLTVAGDRSAVVKEIAARLERKEL